MVMTLKNETKRIIQQNRINVSLCLTINALFKPQSRKFTYDNSMLVLLNKGPIKYVCFYHHYCYIFAQEINHLMYCC